MSSDRTKQICLWMTIYMCVCVYMYVLCGDSLFFLKVDVRRL